MKKVWIVIVSFCYSEDIETYIEGTYGTEQKALNAFAERREANCKNFSEDDGDDITDEEGNYDAFHDANYFYHVWVEEQEIK